MIPQNKNIYAIIISSGTELIKGLYYDKNSSWLSARLEEVGIKTKKHITVGDNLEHIKEIFSSSADEADVVICTGGLGPTKDDLTRDAASFVFNRDLVLDQPSLKLMEERFSKRNIKMPQTNVIQAMVPSGSIPIKNHNGTASGFVLQNVKKARVFAALPGPPRELHPMFFEQVLPLIKQEFKGLPQIKTFTFHTIGLPESFIEEKIPHFYNNTEYDFTILSHLGMVDLIFSVQYFSEKTFIQFRNNIEKEVFYCIGKKNIFGYNEDTIETVVGKLYSELGLKIATAESCTGGLISKRLTDIPGSSKYFIEGFVTYSNEAKVRNLGVDVELLKQYGAVSKEVSEAMAVGARKISGSDVAVSVTGIAGPDGGTAEKPVGLVYFGFTDGTTTFSEKHNLLGKRDEIRTRSSIIALDLLRKYALKKKNL